MTARDRNLTPRERAVVAAFALLVSLTLLALYLFRFSPTRTP